VVSADGFYRIVARFRTNSYKMALARALLAVEERERVPLVDLAEHVVASYYRHAVLYRLQESTNPRAVPVAVQVVQWATKQVVGDGDPPRRPPARLLRLAAREITEPQDSPADQSFFRYVLGAWSGDTRYPRNGGNDYFAFSRDEGWLEYSPEFASLIESQGETLKATVALSWASFLEKFNDSPKLVSKVSLNRPTRRIRKFADLFRDFPEVFEPDACWLCGAPLDWNDCSLDHLVPFTFQYGDDLWNLVPTHGACNSSKNDRIAPPAVIERTIRRNAVIWDTPAEALGRWSRDVAPSRDRFVDYLPEAVEKAQRAGFRVWQPA